MAEVHAFPGVTEPERPAKLQPNTDAIELLEKTLAEARAGKIRSVAVAVVEEDTRTAQWWAGVHCHRLMASVMYLQHRMAASNVSESAPSDWAEDEPS